MGSFDYKRMIAEQLWHFFESLAEELKTWEESTKGGNRGVSSDKRGVLQLDDFDKVRVEISMLKRTLESQTPAIPPQVVTPATPILLVSVSFAIQKDIL